ncbi:MAG: ATP-binding protein [Firmicutes bacterium]|nr:ATP-binding protein [Bacillota bacterium]
MNLNRLLFFDNIRNDEIVKLAQKITDSAACSPQERSDMYYELQRRLLAAVPAGDVDGTYWENYICRLVEESENTFSLAAEKAAVDDTVRKLSVGDVADIMELFALDWEAVSAEIGDGRPCVCNMKPPVEEDRRGRTVRDALLSQDTETAASKLEKYYAENFCGILGKYRAFVWDGTLAGVRNQDPITFDDLIGYEHQQQQLIRNTEVFVEGRRANNVLLYGDKGTGKSSSVKALLNMFGDKGLRMINVAKDRIFEINTIMESVADRGCKFIIFIDDLSFENTEIEYKHFKSVLEGGVEVQPSNVLVYVTSNRRNLVKETWKDRNSTEGEVHVSDGIHERQSLADRFGLTITFTAPDKLLYAEIVKSIANREGLEIEESKLMEEANKWDMRQTSRSGRSAKQFVTHIAGQQK